MLQMKYSTGLPDQINFAKELFSSTSGSPPGFLKALSGVELPYLANKYNL